MIARRELIRCLRRDREFNFTELDGGRRGIFAHPLQLKPDLPFAATRISRPVALYPGVGQPTCPRLVWGSPLNPKAQLPSTWLLPGFSPCYTPPRLRRSLRRATLAGHPSIGWPQMHLAIVRLSDIHLKAEPGANTLLARAEQLKGAIRQRILGVCPSNDFG
jgi:hypothetical protein